MIPAHTLCSFPSSPPAFLACLQLSRTCILGKAWGGGSRLIITTAKFPTAEKIRNVNHPQSDMSKDGCQANGTDINFLTFKLKSCSIKVKTFVKENIGDHLKITYNEMLQNLQITFFLISWLLHFNKFWQLENTACSCKNGQC